MTQRGCSRSIAGGGDPAGRRGQGWTRWYAEALPRAEQLYEILGVTPGRVSQIERGELSTIDAVVGYVEALGSRLDLVASFGDHT